MIQLPHKLSELARIALDDVVAVEQLADRYVVEMEDVFHAPDQRRSRCVVCAGGAIMVQRLDARPDRKHVPYDFGDHNATALLVVDMLRRGAVGGALWIIGESGQRDHYLDRELPAYAADGHAWHEAMEQLIEDLEGVGL